MAATSAAQVVDAFAGSYKSTDLRVVAARSGEGWETITSSLAFSYLTPDEIKAKHTEIRKRLGATLGDRLRFCLDAGPSKQWKDRARQFSEGKLVMKDASEIACLPFTLGDLRATDTFPTFSREDEWKIIEAQEIAHEIGKKFGRPQRSGPTSWIH